MDEDVFLDDCILAEDEAALLMIQRDEALASRLARWKRPALPADLATGCSRAVGTASFPFSLIRDWTALGSKLLGWLGSRGGLEGGRIGVRVQYSSGGLGD